MAPSKILFFPDLRTARTLEGEVIASTDGGFFLKVRYRGIFGWKRTMWITDDDVFRPDEANDGSEHARALH